MTRQWTAQVQWPNGETEEVDATADDKDAALAAIRAVLATDEYQPGGVIRALELRTGGLQVRSSSLALHGAASTAPCFPPPQKALLP